MRTNRVRSYQSIGIDRLFSSRMNVLRLFLFLFNFFSQIPGCVIFFTNSVMLTFLFSPSELLNRYKNKNEIVYIYIYI